MLKNLYNQRQPTELFFKKGGLKNFAKLTGKHLCQSLYLIIKFDRGQGFPVNFAKFLRTYFHKTPPVDCLDESEILLAKKFMFKAIYRNNVFLV